MTKNIPKTMDNFYIFITILIWLIAIVAVFFVNYHKESKKSHYIDGNIITLDIAYRASMNKYSLLSKYIFEQSINNKDVLSLFEEGLNAKGEEKDSYRQLLYAKLHPLYEKLQQEGIRQLQFITKDNISYLRFHKYYRYDDNLSTYRKTIRIANKENKSVASFETGRVVSGFRNVFPLNFRSRHIGSVEIGMTTTAIIDALIKLDPRREYKFMLRKDIVFPKLFKEQRHLYKDSKIDSDFVIENFQQSLSSTPKILSETVLVQINQKLFHNKQLHVALEKGKQLCEFVEIDNVYYDVSFVPMLGIDKHIEGYLLAYKKSENIPIILTMYMFIDILILFVALMLSILIFLLKQNHNTIHYQKEWFESINNSLGEGIYVMDMYSSIIYVNSLACEILGYTKEELIGKNAHYLFHSHYLNGNLPQHLCPILKGIQKEMKMISNLESFTCKDGHIIPVHVNSRPIFKNEKIHHIVTTFEDISEKRKLEERNNLLLKALEVSYSAVMITDINAVVEWVNPAFELLTGFCFEDVIGKNPKEIIQSGQQTQEFYEIMWKTILDKKPWKGELINKRKDGSLYYEELAITPIKDANNEIKYFVAIKNDISERKKIENSLQYVALHDALTDLPNRRFLVMHLEKIIASISDLEKYIAILFLDLDGFKNLNDINGHDAGDELLVQVASRLQKNTRKQDIAARLGGDEFVIVLDGLSGDIHEAKIHTQKIAEKIRQSIAVPFHLKKITYMLTVSIGITIFNDTAKDVNKRLDEADKALYNAKAKGRNGICLFED